MNMWNHSLLLVNVTIKVILYTPLCTFFTWE